MASSQNQIIRFIVNGKPVAVYDADPSQSILSYLRENLHLTGTKEGCAEGDCGACTVVLAELDNRSDAKLSLKAINACMQFVPTLAGKALFTVEGLRQKNGALHPVQQAMINSHGSQCGFCTPGFIMSLWSLYLEHSNSSNRPSQRAIRTALSGNLCRCTGYKPILAAAEQMFDLPPVTFEQAELIKQLKILRDNPTSEYTYAGTSFYTPRRLQDLLQLRANQPQATLLAGSTDISIWVNKQQRDLGNIIYLSEVEELKTIEKNEQHLYIGAAVSLNDAYATLNEYYPQLQELWLRFASPPIRNTGTLCGNVANGSPIGDSMPWLLALSAQVVIRSQQQQRTIALEELYLDYMENSLREDEIIQALLVPLPKTSHIFRTYKISKRYDSDISSVCAAFRLQLEQDKIIAARVAYGGMAAIPKRALNCEQALVNASWCETTARNAMQALLQDYSPLSDARASSDNRYQTAQNLLYRFYLETRLKEPLPAHSLSVFAA